MPDTPPIHLLSLQRQPMQVMMAWPASRRLVMLHSARRHPRWARWSLLAEPKDTFIAPSGLCTGQDHDPLRGLGEVVTSSALPAEIYPHLPFIGGWIGFLSYDLGRVIEPRAGEAAPATDDRHWPLIELAWCPDALLFDHQAQRWWSIGETEDLLEALEGAREGLPGANSKIASVVGPLTSSMSLDQYCGAVEQTLAYIRAGDIYQANVTQRFSCAFTGSTRTLWSHAVAASGPWYGAYLEMSCGWIISLSPELFLEVDAASRMVTTRPIKGTRSATVDAADLARSEKDAAELYMIVDLMRNDLGRVCEYGSVRVRRARTIETHPTVHHGVGEVVGRLRQEVGATDLLRATFPPGSVTGAPKIRAMQIIDELEPVRRGPYCGAIGFIDRRGGMTLNVAIRTLALQGEYAGDRCEIVEQGVLDYGAGGGIVADSVARDEYAESAQKSQVLHRTLAALRRPAASVGAPVSL